MSPCDEYKKLVKEWKAAKGKQADSLKSAMERHVLVCNACKNG
jgi:hypothetical protein